MLYYTLCRWYTMPPPLINCSVQIKLINNFVFIKQQCKTLGSSFLNLRTCLFSLFYINVGLQLMTIFIINKSVSCHFVYKMSENAQKNLLKCLVLSTTQKIISLLSQRRKETRKYSLSRSWNFDFFSLKKVLKPINWLSKSYRIRISYPSFYRHPLTILYRAKRGTFIFLFAFASHLASKCCLYEFAEALLFPRLLLSHLFITCWSMFGHFQASLCLHKLIEQV